MYSNTGWIGIADQQLNIQSVREEFQRTGIRVLKHGHDGSGRPIQYSARENRIPAETALSYWDKGVVGVANLQSDIQLVSAGFRRKHQHVCKCGSYWTGWLTTEYSIDKSTTSADIGKCIQIQEWSGWPTCNWIFNWWEQNSGKHISVYQNMDMIRVADWCNTELVRTGFRWKQHYHIETR